MARGQLSVEDRLRIKVTRLTSINRRYKEHIVSLEQEVAFLRAEDKRKDEIIQTLVLRVEELARIVFRGKKKQTEEDDDRGTTTDKPPRAPRGASSYRRPVPKNEDIAREEHHALSTSACACGTPHTKKRRRTFYVEDIILPTEENPLTETVAHTVEQWYCPRCRRWTSALPLPSATVVLGERVRALVAHHSIILRISYEQIERLLLDQYRFPISSGEIAGILNNEAALLALEHERLKEDIRSKPAAHYDETSYPVQIAGEMRYAWVMAAASNTDTVFEIGKSRGKGEAEKLKGDADHIGITDGYNAYANLFKKHQLCWAHPDRKIAGLGRSPSLDEKTKQHCKDASRAFSMAYKHLRTALSPPFDLRERKRAYPALSHAFDAAASSHARDPQKLATIKQSLREGKASYFTCLFHPGIPPDNNKAERSLRHLVIKRKISFGVKTDKGARTLSTLASVMLSLWWRKPVRFFDAYLALRERNRAVLQGV